RAEEEGWACAERYFDQPRSNLQHLSPFFGTPEDCAQRLRGYLESGLTTVVARIVSSDVAGQGRLLMDELRAQISPWEKLHKEKTMPNKADLILYVGTAEGLYFAETKNHAYEARPLGLRGKGALRTPVVVDRNEPRRLYAATSRAGVFRSDDGGETWREINEGVVYKEAWSLVQHPRTGELCLGTGPSSVFKSSDGGESWIDCDQLRTLPKTEE